MLDRVKSFIIAALLRIVYGTISSTWRVEKKDEPRVDGGCLYAHWHGDELALIGPFSNQSMAVLVSKSRDGEMLNRLLGWWGYVVVRGSSSRGGVEGLKGLVDEVRMRGRIASLAVDGPRGPRGVVKAGILKLAQVTGRPIVPGVAVCRRAFVFEKSWNKAFVPWPFSRVRVQYGAPLFVPPTLSDTAFESMRLGLEKELSRLKTVALQTPL